MAYMTIQINFDPSAAGKGPSVGDLSYALKSGDSTKPDEILQNVKNLIDGIQAGVFSADVSLSSSTVTGTVSGQTGGTAKFTVEMR